MLDRKYFRRDIMKKCENMKTPLENRMNDYAMYVGVFSSNVRKQNEFTIISLTFFSSKSMGL